MFKALAAMLKLLMKSTLEAANVDDFRLTLR